MKSKGIANCPLCKSKDVTFIYRFADSPAIQQRFYASYKEAIRSKVAVVELYGCKICGLVFNSLYDPRKARFSSEYDNRMGASESYKAYLASMAESLIKKYDLKNKRVADVGCGRGDFLEILWKLGVRKLSGFDKTYVPQKSELDKLVKRSYANDSNFGTYDFIICRNVLPYVRNQINFVKFLFRHLADGGTMYFEVQDLAWIIKNRSVFDFYYEYPTYLSRSSLAFIFSGYKPTLGSILEGQFLKLEVGKEKGTPKRYPISDFNYARGFTREEITKYENLIAKIPKPFIVWGAGAKGTSFLNRLKIDSRRCPYIIDANPGKQGKFLPITGQQVVLPKILKKEDIKTIIIANPIYKKEIQAVAKRIGYKGKFVLL